MGKAVLNYKVRIQPMKNRRRVEQIHEWNCEKESLMDVVLEQYGENEWNARMWMDLELCKGLTEMNESQRNKLVFDCWKYMADIKVKIVCVNVKMEEGIAKLEAEIVSLGRFFVMKANGIRNRKVGSGFLDMDDLIQAGCFSEERVHLLQEGKTKLFQRCIHWITDTHLSIEGRMD
ncbi:hypothetical protein FHG87_024586 [Trinorchestia longiramus]|nr:hypothetical protein FHG87_024586 [Trinorchestia longiramus]